MTRDERRTARLLFDRELEAGTVRWPDLAASRAVRDAGTTRPVPSPFARAYQRWLGKRGRLTYESDTVAPVRAARRAVLGDAADAPPRVLVRVDEFPHWLVDTERETFATEAYERFHAVLRDAGVPYLVAVVPRPARDPGDPKGTGDRGLTTGEREALATFRRDGVAFGLHGLDHRTRHRDPRRHSELTGLKEHALVARVERGIAELAGAAIHPRVFVPPFNRFARAQWPPLAQRFDVVTGGPESVRLLGMHRTPSFRGDAVWLPSLEPFYGPAKDVVAPVERAVRERWGVWLPVVLHWGWELRDDLEGLRRLAAVLAGVAEPWDAFLDAVARADAFDRSVRSGSGERRRVPGEEPG